MDGFIEKLLEKMDERYEIAAEGAKEKMIADIQKMDSKEFMEKFHLRAAWSVHVEMPAPGRIAITAAAENAHPVFGLFHDEKEMEKMDNLFQNELKEFITRRMVEILGEENTEIVEPEINETEDGCSLLSGVLAE